MSYIEIQAFFLKYSIIDWILAIISYILGKTIENSSFDNSFNPFLNTEINYPLKTETISYNILVIFMYILGGFIVLGLWLLFRRDFTISKLLSSYYCSITFTLFVSSVIKKIVGRPRPDTIALCGGDGSYQQCATVLTSQLLADQFKSFPSGHSAESMASAIFISLLLSELWSSGSMFSAIMKIVPIFWSIFIGISRIWDHAHHIDDVLAGYLLGALIGSIVFHTFKVGMEIGQRKNNNTTDVSASQFSAYV